MTRKLGNVKIKLKWQTCRLCFLFNASTLSLFRHKIQNFRLGLLQFYIPLLNYNLFNISQKSANLSDSTFHINIFMLIFWHSKIKMLIKNCSMSHYLPSFVIFEVIKKVCHNNVGSYIISYQYLRAKRSFIHFLIFNKIQLDSHEIFL